MQSLLFIITYVFIGLNLKKFYSLVFVSLYGSLSPFGKCCMEEHDCFECCWAPSPLPCPVSIVAQAGWGGFLARPFCVVFRGEVGERMASSGAES